MCNTNSRFILFLLTFFMIFNFIFEYKAHAEAIALSAGLVLFLKACAAAGVTYIAAKEVSRVTEDSIKLYNEWQKFIKNKPPNDKPPVDWEKTAFLTLLGLQMSDTFMKLVDSVKDFFKELGAKEGENNSSTTVHDDPKNKYGSYYVYNVTNGSVVYPSFIKKREYYDNNNYREVYNLSFEFKKVSEGYRGYSVVRKTYYRHFDKNGKFISENVATSSSNSFYSDNFGFSGTTYAISMNPVSSHNDGTYVFRILDSSGDVPNYSKPTTFNYYFEDNSYQFTGNPDDIKQVYPNLNNLPEGKLLTVTNSDGKVSTYYKGSIDDLFNDWQKSQSAGNIFGSKPVNAVQTGDVIKIEDNSDSLPYPEIPTEPQTDTPTALGQIITLLKQLVNWSSNIFNKIPEPQTEPEPNPLELPQKVELDFSPLQGLLVTDKFPFCLPWDLKRCVEKLISPGSPPRWEVEMVTEKFIIDFSQFETLAAISRSFFALIYVVALVVITRRFISGA